MIKYHNIIFMYDYDDEQAERFLNGALEDNIMTESEMIDYLSQWDYDETIGENREPWGTEDETFEIDDYVLSWNTRLGYVALTRLENIDND